MYYLSEVVEAFPSTVQRYVRGVVKSKVCGKGEFCSCNICKAVNMGTSIYCCEFGGGETLSVSDVRRAIRLVSRKVGKYRAILFRAYSKLSEKSANSLLKLVEEPPNNTQVFIGVKSQWMLSTTILSRCSVNQLEFIVAGEGYQLVVGRDLETQYMLLRKWNKEKQLFARVHDIVHALWQRSRYGEAYNLMRSMLVVEKGGNLVEILYALRGVQ